MSLLDSVKREQERGDAYLVSEEDDKIVYLHVFEYEDDEGWGDTTVVLFTGSKSRNAAGGQTVSWKWGKNSADLARPFLAALVRALQAGEACPTTPTEGEALAARYA